MKNTNEFPKSGKNIPYNKDISGTSKGEVNGAIQIIQQNTREDLSSRTFTIVYNGNDVPINIDDL